uniref:DUF5741 domain-containing protein n=1 Tax=Trichobilharzia regenti TaxID=157069 RepID=A0AA85K3R9_TRIRE|nr:unnamed protein product [Trichobilharzia regenti]
METKSETSDIFRKSNRSNIQNYDNYSTSNLLSVGRTANTEQMLVEMRRENFRLKLKLYDYEKMYRRANVPEDLESTRVYADESEKVLLREALKGKTKQLISTLKVIDSLKEENSQLHQHIDELKGKYDKSENDWRDKYDTLQSELKSAQEKVHTLEMSLLAKETEFAKCKNELQSSIARLQAELASSQHNNKRYRREIQMFQTETNDLRETLESLSKSHVDVKDFESGDLHKSIQSLCIQSPQSNVKSPTAVTNLSPSLSPSSHGNAVVRTPLKDFNNLCSQQPTEDSYAKLTDRLNTARHLILELGNEKLRTDKVVASMKSAHEKELSALKDKCEMAENQLMNEKQLNHEELCRKDAEIERLNSHISELIEKLDTSLSVREKLQFDLNNLSEQLVRRQREVEDLHEQLNSARTHDSQKSVNLDESKHDECNHASCTPCVNSTMNDQKETHSIRRLRNLYDLIHNLMLRLNDVRFTQNSVVEMINRSLATVEVESSFQAPPLRKALSFSGDIDRHSSDPNRLTLSRAEATYGGCNTLIENLDDGNTDPVIASSRRDQQLAESVVSSDFNETVAELRFGCPKSPVAAKPKYTAEEYENSGTSKPSLKHSRVQKPTTKSISLCRKLFSAPKFKDQMKNLAGSVSMYEDLRSSTQNLKKADLLYHSFTEDIPDITFDKSIRKPTNVGDLTMVEWEHKDIFERLSQAMSKLRDAIEECSDIGSEFWDLDVKKQISMLLTSQADSFHSHMNQLNDSVDADSVNFDVKEAVKMDSKLANRSARFDGGVLPPFDPIGFVSHNDEASLSQLYGSAWRQPMDISGKSQDKNLILSDIQSDISFTESNQVSKGSAPMTHDDYEELAHELRNLNDKVTNLEAENSSLRKANSDLQEKMNVSIMTTHRSQHISHEIVPSKYDNSSIIPRHDMSIHQNVEVIKDVLAQYEEENLELRNECDRLRNLFSSAPSKDDIDVLNTELSNRVTIINTVIERLQSVSTFSSECSDVIQLVDIVISELNESRTSIMNLEDQICKLKKCLNESVSLYDYQSLENEAISLKEELKLVLDQTDQYKQDVQYVFDTLLPLVSFTEFVSLKSLVNGVVQKFNDQEIHISSLTSELQSTLQLFNTDDSFSIPQTLDECIALYKNCLSDCKTTIDQLQSDKIHALNMIKELAPKNEGLCTLSNYVNWFINVFNDKKCSFETLEQNYVQVQESLCQSIQKYENLKTTVDKLNTELQSSQSHVNNLQNELTSVINSHVPIENYELVNSQMNALKEELRITHSKTVEYEREREFVKQLIEGVLERKPINLKDDIQELCTRLSTIINDKCKTNLKEECEEGGVKQLAMNKSHSVKMSDNLSSVSEEIANKEYGEHHIKVTGLDKLETFPQNICLNDNIQSMTSVRKYTELKTAAFEVRNKLISRTQKLEVALKEIDRLRSVIEQDKERASKTLEEVKELRQKVLRKNQRIRDLEADVARLKSCSSKAIVGNARVTDSSVRLTSDAEQHRGCAAQQNSLTEENVNHANRIIGSTAASLLRCPATPGVSTENLLEQLTNCTVSCDSTPLDNTDDPVSLIHNDELALLSHQNDACIRCRQLNKLLPELHNTTLQLKKLITLNSSNEDSLLGVLNNIEQQTTSCSLSYSQSMGDSTVKFSHSNNGLVDQSLAGLLINPNITDNVKTCVESLHHVRLKLNHYAKKMDHLCTALVHHYDKSSSQTNQISSDADEKPLDLLCSIIKNLENLFHQENLSDNETAKGILINLHQFLGWIQSQTVLEMHHTLNSNNNNNNDTDDNKEVGENSNQHLQTVKSLSCSDHHCETHKKQAKHYRRKYHQLLQSVDNVAKNLADTTNVISCTRSHLENIAGLVPISDRADESKQ